MNETTPKERLRKTPALYIVMLAAWAGLCAWLWYNLGRGFVSLPFRAGVQPSAALRAAACVLVARSLPIFGSTASKISCTWSGTASPRARWPSGCAP